MKFAQLAFGREAYLFFLVTVLIALAFADLPVSIFLGLAAAIVIIGVLGELLSRLASKKLAAMSGSAEAADGVWSVVPVVGVESGNAASVALLLRTFAESGDALMGPEFSQTEDWFAKTAVGSFA